MKYILIITAALITLIIYKYIGEEKININNIVIKERFKKHPPKDIKLFWKEKYYIKHGYFYDKIILDELNVLLDGYTSYIIAKDLGMKKVHVTRKYNKFFKN